MKNKKWFQWRMVLILATALMTGLAVPNAHARSQYDSTYDAYHQIQNALFMVIGWPSAEAYCVMNGGTYANSTCTGVSNGPPVNGIVAFQGSFAATVYAAVAASGISTCSAFPTSGAGPSGSGTVASMGDYTYTSTYAAPTHTVPANFTNGGSKYTTRINVLVTGTTSNLSGYTLKIALENVCGSNEVFFESKTPFGSTAYMTLFLWTDLISSTDQKVEMALVVRDTVSDTSGLNQAELMRFASNGTGGFTINDVSLQSNSGVSGASDYHAYRTGMNGSGPDNVSVYLQSPNNQGSMTRAQAAADAVVDYTSEAATNFAFSGVGFNNQVFGGCANFKTKADPSSATLCTGLPLSTPSAPAIDSSGSFSYANLLTLQTKVVEDF